MSEQDITFEKFFPRPLAFADKAHELEMMSKWNDAKITWETSLEAATAEANKRIEALESEVAAFEAISFVQMKQIDELKASNNTLREALEETTERLQEICDIGKGLAGDSKRIYLNRQLLTATPAESLQSHDDVPVCEECGATTHPYAMGNISGWACSSCGWSADDLEEVK